MTRRRGGRTETCFPLYSTVILLPFLFLPCFRTGVGLLLSEASVVVARRGAKRNCQWRPGICPGSELHADISNANLHTDRRTDGESTE